MDNSIDNFSVTGLPWYENIIESNNGGKWQNITAVMIGDSIFIESFGQKINIERSIPHKIYFEFTSQKFAFTREDQDWYAAVDVLLNNNLIYTTPIDSTRFSWETHEIIFIPNQKEIEISFRINVDNFNSVDGTQKYVGIDGVQLCPIKTGMFCEH